MSWLDLVENPQPIRSTYGEEVPDLTEVDLLSVTLDRSIRRALLMICTRSFPSDPPKKWKGSNTVALTLSFDRVTDLSVNGWTDARSGNFQISEAKPEVRAFFGNNEYSVMVQSEFLHVDKLSAYITK